MTSQECIELQQQRLERFKRDFRKQQELEGVDVYGYKVKLKEGESLEDGVLREYKEHKELIQNNE
tara:strand:+ start:1438 stop:1632 length:195 start_codon:yes stop_codon:yes gene_type:complete